MASMAKKTITRWVDANGKRVPSGTPGATKVTEESAKYYGFDIPGFDKPQPLATHKGVASKMLQDLIERGERGQAGMTDPVADNKNRPLAEVLDLHIQQMADEGNTSARHRRVHKNRIGRVIAWCKWKVVGDLSGDDATRCLAEWRRLPKKDGGISAQTSNHYRTHLRTFGYWLADPDRQFARTNLFLKVKSVNADVDRRHLRRDLLPEELTRLLETVRGRKETLRGLTPEERYWLYLCAAVTGFRAGELNEMTPAHFHLEADPPVALAAKKDTKNKRGACQPLPEAIVPALRVFLRDRPRDRPVWDSAWYLHCSDIIARDLAACDPPIPYKVESPDGPLFADFHALRHTYISMMTRVATVKVAQVAARHSTTQMTERYAHTHNGEVVAGVNALPVVFSAKGPTLVQQAIALAERMSGKERAELLCWLNGGNW